MGLLGHPHLGPDGGLAEPQGDLAATETKLNTAKLMLDTVSEARTQ